MVENWRGKYLSEYLGTMFLILLGNGVVAVAVLTGAFSGQWQPAVLWGLTVALIVYATGAISGAHINPAVTITMAAYRGFPKEKILPYISFQVLGAFTGAAILYGLLSPLIKGYEAAQGIVRGAAGSEQTALIFSTFPHPELPVINAFFIEVVLTAFLLLFILSLTDERNSGAGQATPLVIGLVVALLVGIGGPLTMAAINPARDFGPRLFTFFAGWGSIAIPGPNNYFWVPILGPITGGLLGGFIYTYLLRPFIPHEEEETIETTEISKQA